MADKNGVSKSSNPPSVGDASEYSVVDNPYAPVISFDGFAGIAVRDHTVKINLTNMQGGHPKSDSGVQEVVVARLSISTAALARVHHVLSESIARMQKEGVVPVFDPKTENFEWSEPDRPEKGSGSDGK
tara:strand:+ start:140 stop:526 length:387 start_codon:yes stop_codon:yes gene_type:complete